MEAIATTVVIVFISLIVLHTIALTAIHLALIWRKGMKLDELEVTGTLGLRPKLVITSKFQSIPEAPRSATRPAELETVDHPEIISVRDGKRKNAKRRKK